MWTAEFRDVGRGKRSWDETWPYRPSDGEIVRAIKRRKALGSRGIDLDWNDDEREAGIYVGVFRRVGTVTLAQASEREGAER